MCLTGDSYVTTALVYVLMEGDAGTRSGEFTSFCTTGSGSCVIAEVVVPTKSNYGALGAPHWFVQLSTSSAGLLGAHVKKPNCGPKRTDSLAHFLLWLLSNNHQSVFP